MVECLGGDLEAFAGHGKRSVINVEDVKVCDRGWERGLRVVVLSEE
jgi:CENP-S protein